MVVELEQSYQACLLKLIALPYGTDKIQPEDTCLFPIRQVAVKHTRWIMFV